MSLTKKLPGSNAADASSDTDAPSGGVGKEGFTKMDFPSQKPAGSNSDVSTTKESIGSMGNEGTNMSSYHDQPKTISAVTGK